MSGKARSPNIRRARLDIIQPGKRSLVRCLLDYIDDMQQQDGNDTLTVLLPEITETSPVGRLLRQSHHAAVEDSPVLTGRKLWWQT